MGVRRAVGARRQLKVRLQGSEPTALKRVLGPPKSDNVDIDSRAPSWRHQNIGGRRNARPFCRVMA